MPLNARHRIATAAAFLLWTWCVGGIPIAPLLPAAAQTPEDDPLSTLGPDPHAEASRAASQTTANQNATAGLDPHLEAFAESLYPSARTCAKCHQQIYDEWRVSAHAYAAISPMFHCFEQAVQDLTAGTMGTFCVRCHSPLATQMRVPREASQIDGPAVLREGITCVVCHRVVERYGRVNGERRVEPGDIYAPVVGTSDGSGLAAVLADADRWKVKTDPADKRPGQPIHLSSIRFEQLSDSSFCAPCHQVVVQPGVALEIVYQQYRSGPACKQGISCQDCHMGAVPGKPLGYAAAPIAVVDDKPVRPGSKHSNHIFHGPSYPLTHPGLFPHHEKSLRWQPEDWVQFDWQAGWGTEEFERTAPAQGGAFPPAWGNRQERRDAREIIDDNLRGIEAKRENAAATLQLSSEVLGPFFASDPALHEPLVVSYVVANTSLGHNMPSGSLGAQPQLWLNVVLVGPDGSRVFESGDLDRWGDLRDVQSIDVQQGLIPADRQLASYQTKFLITNVKGTEREFFFPLPVDADPLPYIRPGTVPYSVLNHPPLVRMEAHSIPPLDRRSEKFRIPAEAIRQPGRYRLSVRLRSRVEPPYFARFCGLPQDALAALVERSIDVHGQSYEFTVPQR